VEIPEMVVGAVRPKSVSQKKQGSSSRFVPLHAPGFTLESHTIMAILVMPFQARPAVQLSTAFHRRHPTRITLARGTCSGMTWSNYMYHDCEII
jgi:hypothetical protein